MITLTIGYAIFILILYAMTWILWTFFTVLFALVFFLGLVVYRITRPRILKDYATRKLAQEDVHEFPPKKAPPPLTASQYNVPRPDFVSTEVNLDRYISKHSPGMVGPLILWFFLWFFFGIEMGGRTMISFFLSPTDEVLLDLLLFSLTALLYYGIYRLFRRHAINPARKAKFNEFFGKLLLDLLARSQQRPLVELEELCQDHGLTYTIFVQKLGEVTYPYLYERGDMDLNSKRFILKPQYVKPEQVEERVTTELQTELGGGGRFNLTQFARKIGFDFDRMQGYLYRYAGQNHVRGHSEINPEGEYIVFFERGADPQFISELDHFFRSTLEAEISGAGKKQGGKV